MAQAQVVLLAPACWAERVKMVVCGLHDDDLDDEDRAAIAEVAKKGYYHSRPKNEACPPPQLIRVSATPLQASSAMEAREKFDDYQRKWDRFGRDDFISAQTQANFSTPAGSQTSSDVVTPDIQNALAPGKPSIGGTKSPGQESHVMSSVKLSGPKRSKVDVPSHGGLPGPAQSKSMACGLQ